MSSPVGQPRQGDNNGHAEEHAQLHDGIGRQPAQDELLHGAAESGPAAEDVLASARRLRNTITRTGGTTNAASAAHSSGTSAATRNPGAPARRKSRRRSCFHVRDRRFDVGQNGFCQHVSSPSSRGAAAAKAAAATAKTATAGPSAAARPSPTTAGPAATAAPAPSRMWPKTGRRRYPEYAQEDQQYQPVGQSPSWLPDLAAAATRASASERSSDNCSISGRRPLATPAS